MRFLYLYRKFLCMPRLFVILFIAYFAGNLYILLRGWQAFKPGKTGRKIVFTCIAGLLGALFPALFLQRTLLPAAGSWVHLLYETGTGWLIFTLYTVAGLILADIILVAGRLFNLKTFATQPLRTRYRRYSFWSIFTLVIIVLSIGYYRYQHPSTQVFNIVINKPLRSGGKTLRIVAVSDVHLGYGTDKRQLQRYVKMINDRNPDLVLIGGDLIDSDVTPLRKERMNEELGRIRAPLGIYMVPGNHEYIAGIRNSEKFIRTTPIRYLRDSVARLPNGLVIAGRDDAGNRRRATLPGLLKGISKTAPVILLDHQPRNLDEAVNAGVDLQFSGHTHEGQVWPVSLWVKKLFELSHGMRRREDTWQYVSSGLALWGPPFRIGTQSELAVFNLQFR